MTDYLSHLDEDRLEIELREKARPFSPAEARAEAQRCLGCADAPCISACPTEIDVPAFIQKVATGNDRGSARTIFAQNILGESCSRACPVEVLCEGACVYNAWQRPPIAIGRLQRFAVEAATNPETVAAYGHVVPRAATWSGKRVALVGSGPASLACAAELAIAGHRAVVFERRPLPGGLTTSGIAPYKLHADDALREVAFIAGLGVEIRSGVEIGKDIAGHELLASFDAVFLGLGLGDDARLGIPGEDGAGVTGAARWIGAMKLNAKTPRPGARVVVVGGGNNALDVARECAQLGSESVTVLYRRGPAAMSAYPHEVAAAKLEGVRIVFHARPLDFVRGPDGHLIAVNVAVNARGDDRGDDLVEGPREKLPCDFALVAIGQSKLRDVVRHFHGVSLDARGRVQLVGPHGATGNPKVFSGGDCVNGGKEIVNAVAEGRDVARFLISKWSAKSRA